MSYERDLDKWMPRLIAAWRQTRRGPEGELLPNEIRDLGTSVRKLSMGLTRERELAGARYMDDPKLLGAYLLFYWPVSYAQARQALGELPRPRAVLDLGSGPGPVAFAALDAGAGEVTAADRSKNALALARQLAAEAGEALATREWDPQRNLNPPDGEFDLIALGHVLNELFGDGEDAVRRRARLVELLLTRVKKRGTVLIVEPALRDTSRALLRLRDLLVRQGCAVRAPCLFRGDCPALVKETDWCHAERSWRMPRVVEQIAKAAGLHKEALKMSYLALASKGEPWPELPAGRFFRIVSEPLEGKGRQRYIGCGPEGRLGLALQEKHRTDTNAAFFRLNRGDVVRIGETEPRGDGLSLNEKSEAKVVAPAGKPPPEPWES